MVCMCYKKTAGEAKFYGRNGSDVCMKMNRELDPLFLSYPHPVHPTGLLVGFYL